MNWADAITKEMTSLENLGVFSYHAPNHACPKNEGWQYAPLWMIFEIKEQDLCHKAYLVVGGHIIDASDYITYCSTIQDITI